MDTQAPQAWRSEGFAEDLTGDDSSARDARTYPWTRHAGWLCTVPLVVALLGGLAALLQTLA